MTEHGFPSDEQTVVAVRMIELADHEGFPSRTSWETAGEVRFSADWQGKNADPERETITVFDDSEPHGRRDQLWDRDVAEVFLQPNPAAPRRYKEFEVSPNGMWIDLEIGPGEKHDLKSDLRRRVDLNETTKTWTAELALPMKALIAQFDPAATWRVNFYRVEGATEPRFYSAWQPTRTPVPNFHVPEAFGRLIFAASPSQREH
jgi:alpha-galactosidase